MKLTLSSPHYTVILTLYIRGFMWTSKLTSKLRLFSPIQAQREALGTSQWVLAGERRGGVGSFPSSQDLPPLPEDEPSPGAWQPPLPDRRPRWIWEQRLPEVNWQLVALIHVNVTKIQVTQAGPITTTVSWSITSCLYRSQESLLKASLPGLYRSDSQLYPHVVLQRVPTPTAPSAPSAPSAPLYLHLPPASSAASSPAHATTHSTPHIMTQYPTPTYPPNPNTAVPAYPHPIPAPIYPNPNPTPQRPWQ